MRLEPNSQNFCDRELLDNLTIETRGRVIKGGRGDNNLDFCQFSDFGLVGALALQRGGALAKPKPEAKAMAMEILTSAIIVAKESILKSLVLRKRIDASSRVSRLGT